MKNAPINRSRIQLRDFEVVIPTADGSSVAERIPIRVPMEWDPELGEWLITADAERMIETTKARHMGLLLPEELHALRRGFDLSQKQIGELLQIGEKTWTRWETGRQRPSRSMNLLLRAIAQGVVTIPHLKNWVRPVHDWSHHFLRLEKTGFGQEPVAMDMRRQEFPSDEPDDEPNNKAPQAA